MNIDENPKISKIILTEQITYLEKDFILVVKSKDLDQPRALVEYNPETQINCVMLTLVPKFSLNMVISELVFIVDRYVIIRLKAAQALELLLRSLPEDCYFNVISFGSHYDSLFPKSQLYSETSLSEALNLAQTMTSNYGGTEIYSALEWVFENSRDDMPTSIFLITDGEVWNVDQIVELVSKNEEKKKDDLRLFSLGIGDSVSHNLVESVARAGKGYAQFVTSDERMDKKVIGIFMSDDNIEPPPTTPSDTFTDSKAQQAPYIIPPIYPGVRFIVYCILEKNIEPCKVINLKAASQDGPMKLDIPLDPVTLQGSKIHRLAARKLIQDLDDKKSFIHKYPKIFKIYKKREVPIMSNVIWAKSLSVSYQAVVAQYCAVKAVEADEEKSVNIPPQESSQEVNVDHKEPKIENLFEFLGLQSFDGKFLPSKTFYNFFYKNYLDGFINFKQEIEKELNELSEKEIEEILTSCVAIAYLKVVMFDNFKDECEMCYGKAEKVLKKMIGNNEKEKLITEKAEECIKNWVGNNSS
ncbi:von Willebrand factor A domain-containing protein DDB_G0267758-like [Rhizophagus clarus]|uniref:von Willebrand factor A domain-containing protein DDB_G0267758-like n=1 Tax=Rhizophagus clarus TaxID=94130 RepID=A0A8H3QA58_9GLOM|nr:von Willebrand factor A domain-containing protein DDB_G0267758-like [Rhizophagus clarus]